MEQIETYCFAIEGISACMGCIGLFGVPPFFDAASDVEMPGILLKEFLKSRESSAIFKAESTGEWVKGQ